MVKAAVEVAYELASQQLRGQKDDLKVLRGQAALAATISGLIATVFASLLNFDAYLASGAHFWYLAVPIEFWLVLIPFSSSIYFAILVCTGWKKCIFELSAPWVISQGYKGRSISDIYADLAIDADRYFDQNEFVISEARNKLRWAMISSWVQIPAWLILLF